MLLAFLVFFDALLRPFMSAVLALVIVLKFLNVDNCGRAFVNGGHWAESFNATSSDSMRRTSPSDKLWTSAFLPFHANKSLVLKLDMKSASTLQAAPEELHFYLIPFSFLLPFPSDVLLNLSSDSGRLAATTPFLTRNWGGRAIDPKNVGDNWYPHKQKE